MKLSLRSIFHVYISAVFITVFAAGASFSEPLIDGDVAVVFNLETGREGGVQIIDKTGGASDSGDPLAGVVRPFILPQKLLVSPSDGKISFFDGSAAAPFKLLDGFVLNDARCFEASGGVQKIALLLSDGKNDYIHFLKYDSISGAKNGASPKNVIVGADNSCRISPAAYSRIIGAAGDKVYLQASSETRADKYRADALTGASEKLASAELDGYGAVLAPSTAGGGGEGRVMSLKASGGAVNTLISYGGDLEFLSSSLILSGETRAVFIETALPDGLIVASASRYGADGVLRRQFYSLDSFGRVCELAELERFDYHRQALSDGKTLYLLEARGAKKDGQSGSVAAGLKLHSISREKIVKFIDGYFSRAGSVTVNNWQSFSMDVSAGAVHGAAVCPEGVGAYIFTENGVYYNNTLLPLKLPRPNTAGQAPASSRAVFEASFGGDGKLYARREGENKVLRISAVPGGILDAETIELKGFPAGVKMSGLSACRSSEIYFNDPVSFSMIKFGRDGLFSREIPGAAFAVHGGYAQLFKACDVAAGGAPGKELIEYDDGGNFIRRISGFGIPGGMPCGGAFCAGVDKKWRVFFMSFVPGSLFVRACDYRTGAVVKEASVKFSGVEGRMITPNYRVTDEGLIVFATAVDGPDGRAKVTIHSIDIF